MNLVVLLEQAESELVRAMTSALSDLMAAMVRAERAVRQQAWQRTQPERLERRLEPSSG
jgi:hypothetical protein